MVDTEGVGAEGEARAERTASFPLPAWWRARHRALPPDRRRLVTFAVTALLVGLSAAVFIIAVDWAIDFWLGPQVKLLYFLDSAVTRVPQCGATAASL